MENTKEYTITVAVTVRAISRSDAADTLDGVLDGSDDVVGYSYSSLEIVEEADDAPRARYHR
jgi:hypothetical protein